MNTPEIARTLAAEGSEVAAQMTPEAFRTEFDREYAELEKVVKAASIQLK